MLCFGDFGVDNADNAVTKEKSLYPMWNENKFNVDLALPLLQEENYIRVNLPSQNVFFLQIWTTLELNY